MGKENKNQSPFESMKQDDPDKKKAAIEAALASVFFHILIIVAAASLTVLVIQNKPKTTFEGKKPPGIPPRKLEHSIRVKQMQKQTRKPQILQKLVSQAPSDVSLPELPDLEKPDIKNLKDTPILRTKSASLMGSLGGSGGGSGQGLTGGAGYSDTKFFGEEVRTKAVSILFDITPSMVNKGVLEDVRMESIKMIKSLNPGTKFNIIVFVDGATPFSPQMLFATKENRELAEKWLSQDFNPRHMGQMRGMSGSTPHKAIELAVNMGSDTLFLLTDDPPYLKTGTAETGIEVPDHDESILDYARNIESKLGRSVRINTIAYKPHKNDKGTRAKKFMKQLSRITGGKFKLFND